MARNNGAKRGINFIDIIILLVIVGIIAGAVLLFSQKDSGPDTTEVEVTYQIELTNIVEELAGAVEIGDTLTENRTKSNIGTIVHAKAEPMVGNVMDYDDGVMIKTEIPGRYRIVITSTAPAKRVGDKIVFTDFTMGVGTTVNFTSKHFSGEAVCTAMDIREVMSKEAA